MKEIFKLLLFQLGFTLEYHFSRPALVPTYMQILLWLLLEQVAHKILSRKYFLFFSFGIFCPWGQRISGRGCPDSGAGVPGAQASVNPVGGEAGQAACEPGRAGEEGVPRAVAQVFSPREPERLPPRLPRRRNVPPTLSPSRSLPGTPNSPAASFLPPPHVLCFMLRDIKTIPRW